MAEACQDDEAVESTSRLAGGAASERPPMILPASMTTASAANGNASRGKRGAQAAHVAHWPISGHPWVTKVLPIAIVMPTATPCSFG